MRLGSSQGSSVSASFVEQSVALDRMRLSVLKWESSAPYEVGETGLDPDQVCAGFGAENP